MQLNIYMDKELAEELADAAARQTKRTGRFHTRQDMLKLAWKHSLFSGARKAALQGVVEAKKAART